VADFIFGKGDVVAAQSYAVEHHVQSDTFNQICKIVKSYFSKFMDFTFDILGKVQKFTTSSIDLSQSAITKAVESQEFSDYVNTLGELNIHRFDTLKNAYNGLSDTVKKDLFNKFGEKFICFLSYPTVGSTVRCGMSLHIMDLPEDITGVIYSPGNPLAQYFYKYIKADGSVYNIDWNYSTYPPTYEIVVSSDGNSIITENGSLRNKWITSILSFGFAMANQHPGTSDPFNNNPFNGVELGNLYGSTGSLSHVLVRFNGIDGLKNYNSVDDYNNKKTAPIVPTNFSNNWSLTSNSQVVTTGQDGTEDKEEQAKPVPVIDVTPLDANHVVSQVNSGDTSALDTEAKSITDVLPHSTPTPTVGTVAVGSPIDAYKVPITDIFPFCIPFNIYSLIKVFNSTPTAPTATLSVNIPIINVPFSYTVDLSFLDGLAVVVRGLESILWLMGLMFITSKVIKW